MSEGGSESLGSKEGGYDPLVYELEMRTLLGLGEEASDDEVRKAMGENNAHTIRELLGLYPEATDKEVLDAIIARKK